MQPSGKHPMSFRMGDFVEIKVAGEWQPAEVIEGDETKGEILLDFLQLDKSNNQWINLQSSNNLIRILGAEEVQPKQKERIVQLAPEGLAKDVKSTGSGSASDVHEANNPAESGKEAKAKAKAVDQKGEQDPEGLCCVCLDGPKDHIIVPCGHLCICEACAQIIHSSSKACPICQKQMTILPIRVFDV